MSKTPFTDPFYVGPICGEIVDYTPTIEKNLDVVVFPTKLDITKDELLVGIKNLLDEYWVGFDNGFDNGFS